MFYQKKLEGCCFTVQSINQFRFITLSNLNNELCHTYFGALVKYFYLKMYVRVINYAIIYDCTLVVFVKNILFLDAFLAYKQGLISSVFTAL